MLDLPGRYTRRFLGNSVLLGNRIEMSYLSEVYLGRNLELQLVAVKISHPQCDAALQRSLATLERVMRLSHPNLLTPHQAFVLEDNGERRLVEVSEYLPEDRWETLDNERYRLPFMDSLHAVRQATAGLAEIHHAGLVHHDARATNIFVDLRTHDAKLFDYNMTRPPYGLIKGEPDARNVAPEYRTGGRIGFEFDIWLLGSALRDIATDCTKQEQPWKPEVPPACIEIITRATAERPENRYADAGELLRALEHL